MIDFKRMRWLMKHLPEMLWNIEQKEAGAMKVTAVLTGMPRGGNGNHTEERYITLIEAKGAYQEIYDEFQAMRTELAEEIDLLEDPDEKAMMRLRYLEGFPPEHIAGRFYRSRSWVYKYLTRAERRISKKNQSA